MEGGWETGRKDSCICGMKCVSVCGWERREGQRGERDFTQRKMDVAIQVERRWRNIDEEEVEEEAKCVGDG